MTNEEKLTLLLKVLKEYAETKTCYERDRFYEIHDERELGETVEHAEEYGEIHLARTLLEQIGVEFQYPMMKEND
jgi:tRNA threonylcarbamoyladenosine modification (KEOPS) complex Cgi121 subunit